MLRIAAAPLCPFMLRQPGRKAFAPKLGLANKPNWLPDPIRYIRWNAINVCKPRTNNQRRWPPRTLSVVQPFTWNGKYFDQPLPQLAIDWEDFSAMCAFSQMR